MPSWSSPSPSSADEQSIPFDTTPRILRRPISNAAGHRGADPTGTTPRSPGVDVERAAHRPASGSPSPASTIDAVDLVGALDAVDVSSTRATTMPSSPSPMRSTPSTTMPRSLQRLAEQLTGRRRSGAKSRSQERRLSSRVHQNWREEADVVVEQHRGCRRRRGAPGARRSMPKPKAKPGPLLGIDADGREHVGVHHAAAAQLDPPVPSTCGSRRRRRSRR